MRARPDQDDYFMMIANAVSCRSTCLRMQYGAVIVKHGQVISTGYNGAPSRIPHCETCYREEHHIKPGTQYEMCLDGSTVVKLLDGTKRTIRELAEDGDSVWVYSVDTETGEIVPALAENPRKTGNRHDLVRVTLDNGAEVLCTGEHRIMMRDCTYREAKDLLNGDSLMPMYCNFSQNDGYESISNTVKTRAEGKSRNWKREFAGRTGSVQTHHLVHRLLGETEVSPEQVIHHKNGNKNDNRPENLEVMCRGEHSVLHRPVFIGDETRSKISIAMKKRWEEVKKDPVKMRTFSEIGRKNMSANWADDEFVKRHIERSKKSGTRTAQMTNSRPDAIEARKRGQILSGISRVVFESNGEVTPENYHKKRSSYALSSKLGERGPQAPTVERIVHAFGSVANAFEQAKRYNHKVVSVTPVCGEFPVYDMTVSKYHNFAVDLGDDSCVFVHNCQSVHAEANAIVQAAKHGICVDGGTIYVTGMPCLLCSRLIINSGLVRVVYRDSGRYDDASPKLMERAGLNLWAIWGE